MHSFLYIVFSESVSEEELQEMFSEHGGSIDNFRFFPKDRRMALIQMSTIDESLICLIVSFQFPLVVSYSTKTIRHLR